MEDVGREGPRAASARSPLGLLGLYWLPVVAVAATATLISSIPGAYLRVQLFPHDDKVFHFCEFFGLGWLTMRAITATVRVATWRVAAACVLAIALFGLVDEVHQLFVPRRSFELLDLLADTLGGAAGVAVVVARRGAR